MLQCMCVRVAFVPDDNILAVFTPLKTFLGCFCQVTQKERLECHLLPLLCLFIDMARVFSPGVITLRQAAPST